MFILYKVLRILNTERQITAALTAPACPPEARVVVDRKALTNDALGEPQPKPQPKLAERVAQSCRSSLAGAPSFLLGLFPCIAWVRSYNVKSYLIPDVLAGLSTAVLHVPQGSQDDFDDLSLEGSATGVAISLTLLTGLIQVCFWVVRLDRLAAIVSPAMAEGFLTGCAVMVIVAVATVVSYLLELDSKYNVKVIGHIAAGLPPVNDLVSLLPDAVAIAIVQFVSAFSIADLFGRKQRIRADASQEMLAYGVSSVVGSFFLCIPTGSALARSVVLKNVGAKTQTAEPCFRSMYDVLHSYVLFMVLATLSI
ncbi:hypothetical protein HPB48_008808 [Haemaphysalis longicornis]|uniref:SLC26A/SulP transporter domain-containing protein n=1 Tax=Haemaphysalis longicornis TaxID=44386 RepID=A0A9J6GYY0_HAELO|nr:hypothetical protein HPB48_008808 [Haemaphysalis longicornis]